MDSPFEYDGLKVTIDPVQMDIHKPYYLFKLRDVTYVIIKENNEEISIYSGKYVEEK